MRAKAGEAQKMTADIKIEIRNKRHTEHPNYQ